MALPPDIRIRDFEASELGPLRQLIHDTIDTCYSDVYPERAVLFFKAFRSKEKIIERHQKGKILILEKEGRMVATGAVVGGEMLICCDTITKRIREG